MSTALAVELLGRGVGMPLAPDDAGRMPRAAGPAKVRESVFIILDTEPGERVMRPGFGCGLRRFLMQPNNPATRAQIAREVEQSLRRWEPRITVSQVDATPGNGEPSLVLIEIQYAHLFGGRRDSIVYPFYLE